MDALKAAQFEEVSRIIHRKWGQNALQTARVFQANYRRNTIPTGFSNLDNTLGIGGIPLGETTLLEGFPTSGMTSLAYHLIASAQRGKMVCVYLDLSQAFDASYAIQRCGVDDERLLLVYPEDAPDAFLLARDVLLLPYSGLLIVDAALLTPTAILSIFRSGLSRLKNPLKQSSWTLLGLLPQDKGWQSLTSSLHLTLTKGKWQYTDTMLSGLWAKVHIRKNLYRPAGASTDILIEFGDELS